MRYFFAIIALICTTAIGASAQCVRLGKPIPSIHITPDIDDITKNHDCDYTCLIFAHSESMPCVEAMRNFEDKAKNMAKECVIVVITNEDAQNREAIIEQLNIQNYILAFDDNNRTFKAFGIHYAPFAVIYRTKSSRIEWFGPIHQLDSAIIRKISNR